MADNFWLGRSKMRTSTCNGMLVVKSVPLSAMIAQFSLLLQLHSSITHPLPMKCTNDRAVTRCCFKTGAERACKTTLLNAHTQLDSPHQFSSDRFKTTT